MPNRSSGGVYMTWIVMAGLMVSPYLFGPLAAGDFWATVATAGLALPAVLVVATLLTVTVFGDDA